MATNCDKIYSNRGLSDFINGYLHKDTDDSIITITSNDKCPNKGEIEGALPTAIIASNPTSDKDGIVINGSYIQNQCVRQGDISLKHTRFKSLSISADETQFLVDLGGTTTLHKELIYDRGEKKWVNNCTSSSESTTSVTDTDDSVITWSIPSSMGRVNFPTVEIYSASTERDVYLSAYTIHNGVSHYANVIKFTLSGTSCGCKDSSLSTSSLTFSSTDSMSNPQTVTFRTASCTSLSSAQITRGDNYFTSSVDINSNVITIYPKNPNTGMEDYSGVCTVNYTANGSPCTPLGINLKQFAAGCADCNSFAITSPTSLSFGSGATSSTVTWSGGNCVDVTSIVPSDSWISSAATSLPTQFKINVTENKNVARNGSVIVNFSGGNNCSSSKTITVSQAEGCNCGNFSISPASLNFDKDASGSSYAQELTVTSGECITDITLSFSNGYFTGETRNGKIAVWPTNKNTGLTSYDGTCTVTYSVNGSPCSESSKVINLTQAAAGCADCSTFAITSPSSVYTNIPNTGGTIVVNYSGGNCVEVTSVTPTYRFWITSGDITSNSFTLNVYNNSGDSRTNTIDIGVKCGTSSSTKSITVTQASGCAECDSLKLWNPQSSITSDTDGNIDVYATYGQGQYTIDLQGGNCVEITQLPSIVLPSSASTWLVTEDLHTFGDRITAFTVSLSGNDTELARECELELEYTAKNVPCVSKKIRVHQDAACFKCGNALRIYGGSTELMSADTEGNVDVHYVVGGGNYVINFLSANCLSISEPPTVPSSATSWLSVYNYHVDTDLNTGFTVDAQSNNNTARECELDFVYTVNNEPCNKKIRVHQDAGCGCESVTLLGQLSAFTKDASGNVYGSYQFVDFTSGICITDLQLDDFQGPFSGTIRSDLNRMFFWPTSKNDNPDSRTGSTRLLYGVHGEPCSRINITFIQDGTNCDDCNSFRITSPTSLTFGSGASTSNVTYVGGNCVTFSSATPTVSWLEAIHQNLNGFTLSAASNDNVARSGTVEVYYGLNGAPCDEHKTITVNQAEGCNCGNFSIDASSLQQFDQNDSGETVGSYQQVDISKGECISNIQVGQFVGNFSGRIVDSVNGKRVRIWPTDVNPYSEDRSGSCVVTYTVDNSSCGTGITINLSQAGTHCADCNTFRITNPSVYTNVASNGGEVQINYTGGNCVTVTSVTPTDRTWVTENSISSSNFKLNVSSNSGDQRSQNVTIGIKCGTSQSSHTITVSQVSGCADCSTFAITNPSSQSLSFGSGATSGTVTWSGGNCVAVTSVVPSDSWISSGATSSPTQFKINVTENKNIARNGSVIVNFSGGNCASSATVAVHQDEGCNCNSITIDTSALQDFAYDASGSSYAQELTVTSGKCITDITPSFSNGYFTGEIRNGKIAVWPTSENGDTSDHSCTCTVTWGVNRSPCESSVGITLTQKGRTCNCEDLIIY